ncbi:MAG: tetratricopeptide repeat-containing sulfotransferase family protein, partial [Pseudomonadales bacterium]
MAKEDTGVYQAAFDQAQKLLNGRAFDLALEQVDAILAVHPRDAKSTYLRAVILRQLGRHSDAVTLLEALVKGTQSVPVIYQELGYALHAAGRVDDAISALRTAVKLDPKLSGSWRLLGESLHSEGEAEEAAHAIRQALATTHAHPAVIKAIDLVQQERFGMAEGICRDYLKRNPTDVAVIRLLAEIGVRLGIKGDPEILLEDCLLLAPDFHLARNTYASALSEAQKYEQALSEIQYLERVDPQNFSHSILAASIEVMVGDYEAAIERYRVLTARFPLHAQLHNSHGHALKTVGRQTEAIASYRRAIEAKPDLGETYWNLANLKTFRFEDEEVAQMEQIIASDETTNSDYFHLCFALGKALEDRMAFDASFKYYALGNNRKKEQEGYQASQTTEETNKLISSCTADKLRDAGAPGDPSPDPIFIVGLPRSGSTLLEQILASHSQVDGTSELREMIAIARRLGGKRNRDDVSLYPEILFDLTPKECRDLGAEYLERTHIQRQGAPYFIDKMPNNFQHVALIHRILPNAKIIDARRHPMATCFSGYKQLFAAGQAFTYGQTNIAQYYSDYARLMAHWDEVLPGKVLRVKYENVITSVDTEVRRILDYCGLPFEAGCLSFHETQRAVRTASSEQVRKPIYTDAVEQWRHFEAHLGPMRTNLER